MTEKLIESPKTKLKLDIFVPLNECACMYEHFINRIFSAINEYLKFIEFETKSLDSEKARKLNLHGNCVVLDETEIFLDAYHLKKELPKYLKEKGLL